jgi:hypothetical protein
MFTTVISGHEIILVLSHNVGIQSTSASMFWLVSPGPLLLAMYLLSDRLANSSMISHFARNRSSDACRYVWTCSTLRTRCPSVAEVDVFRKVAWTWRVVVRPSRSPDVASMEFFLRAHLEHVHTNSSHDQDRVARPASCNSDRRQGIKSFSKVCFAAYFRRP